MDNASKRLFVGTFLSQEERQRLKEAREKLEPLLLQEWNCKLRWVRPEKLHMTWLFLGDCDSSSEEGVSDTLSQFTQENALVKEDATIIFDQFDFFPNQAKRSLMALLPNTVPNGFSTLAKSLRNQLLKFCQKRESEELRPHLTIFRFDRTDHRKYSLPRAIDLSGIAPIDLDVSSFSLIHSHHGSSQEDYQILKTYNFKKS